jgi:hypothetical protein
MRVMKSQADVPTGSSSSSTEATNSKRRPSKSPPESFSIPRVILGVVILLLFVVCVGSIIVFWPLSLWLWVVLAVAAGFIMAAFVRLIWPVETTTHALEAGAACTALLAALMAVPVLDDVARPSAGASAPTTLSQSPKPTTPSPSAAPSQEVINASPDFWGASKKPSGSQIGPLIVYAEHRTYNACAGAPGWRVPLAPNELGNPPGLLPEEMLKWAIQHQGIEVSGTRVELTLQGTTRNATVIQGIQLQVVRRARPSAGTHVVSFRQCGGDGESHYLVANLDNSPQLYEGILETHGHVEVVRKKSDRPLSTRIWYVSRSDPERFVIVVYGSKLDYSWQLAIRWLSSDGQQHLTIVNDENGQPFSTAARLSKFAYMNDRDQDDLTKRFWRKTIPAVGE